MPNTAPHERREHPRHPVRADAHVVHASRRWKVELLNMSFDGAGLTVQEELPIDEGAEISLTIELEDIDTPDVTEVLIYQPRKLLRLRGTLVHNRETAAGVSAGVEYRPITEVDQVLLTLLLARPES